MSNKLKALRGTTSKSSEEITELLEMAVERSKESENYACGLVMMGRDGTVNHFVHFGPNSLALLGGIETLRQYVYEHGFSEAFAHE